MHQRVPHGATVGGNAAGGVPLCAGCLRTLDEIAAWAQLSEAGKRAVWAAIGRRRAERTVPAAPTAPAAPNPGAADREPRR
ncbi:MAG: DUF1289 domain-containing protein [Rubrivivax sp.]